MKEVSFYYRKSFAKLLEHKEVVEINLIQYLWSAYTSSAKHIHTKCMKLFRFIVSATIDHYEVDMYYTTEHKTSQQEVPNRGA